MTYEAVMFVDPGLRSGWATWQRVGRRFSAGIADPADMCDIMERWTNEHADVPGLLGFEKFTITQHTARKSRDALHWPWELTGVGRYLAERAARIEFSAEQAPSAAKRFATDARLKTVGWYTPGREDHARDASRHLLLFAAKHRLVDLREHP